MAFGVLFCLGLPYGHPRRDKSLGIRSRFERDLLCALSEEIW